MEEKDFYTYVYDICYKTDIKYKQKRLIPSKSAMREMVKYGLSTDDCLEILEEGFLAPRKRAEGTEEKWLKKGNKIYNVVVSESFNWFFHEEVYVIKHIGRFTQQ